MVHRISAVAYDGHPDFDSSQLRGVRTPPGFILLFTGEMELIEPAHLFLMETCARSLRINGSGKTQAAYADDLAQWWTYLEANGLIWDEISADNIRDYALTLAATISPKSRRKYRPNTLRRRVGRVLKLYNWLAENKLIAEPIEISTAQSVSAALDENPLAHVAGGRAGAVSDDMPRASAPDEEVNPLTMRDLKLVFHELGRTPFESLSTDLRPVRDRLIAETALYTGMRVAEVVSLTQWQILALEREVDPDDPWKPIKLHITKTKGLRARNVFPPSVLVQALLDYISDERDAVVIEARRRGKFKKAGSTPAALFLNGLDSNNRDIGNSVKPHTAMTAFTRAVKRAGLTHVEIGYEAGSSDGELVSVPLTVPNHTFHDLRHTYAVAYYRAEVRDGNSEPWKKLQARLGHKSLKTTMDIYLRHVDVDEIVLSDELATFYSELTNVPL